jgi:hypothetical protein
MTKSGKGDEMRPGAFPFLDNKWIERLRQLPETGMDYWVVSISLKDGRSFNQAVVDSGYLARIRGLPDVPFTEIDIDEIKVTHDKWDWTEKP